ncbi:MAG: type II secretion system protein [Magnetococcales bacterium]|nr:type II secretion system protein [Magnetococcales bacterium]
MNAKLLHDAKTRPMSGFTTVELVMVIVMVGILSVSVLYKSPNATIALSNASDVLLVNYRRTQLLAMRNGGNYKLVFLSPTSYQIQDSSGTPEDDVVDLGTITLSTSPTMSDISFTVMGVPDNVGTLTLTDANSDTITMTNYSESGAIFKN